MKMFETHQEFKPYANGGGVQVFHMGYFEGTDLSAIDIDHPHFVEGNFSDTYVIRALSFPSGDRVAVLADRVDADMAPQASPWREAMLAERRQKLVAQVLADPEYQKLPKQRRK